MMGVKLLDDLVNVDHSIHPTFTDRKSYHHIHEYHTLKVVKHVVNYFPAHSLLHQFSSLPNANQRLPPLFRWVVVDPFQIQLCCERILLSLISLSVSYVSAAVYTNISLTLQDYFTSLNPFIVTSYRYRRWTTRRGKR